MILISLSLRVNVTSRRRYLVSPGSADDLYRPRANRSGMISGGPLNTLNRGPRLPRPSLPLRERPTTRDQVSGWSSHPSPPLAGSVPDPPPFPFFSQSSQCPSGVGSPPPRTTPSTRLPRSPWSPSPPGTTTRTLVIIHLPGPRRPSPSALRLWETRGRTLGKRPRQVRVESSPADLAPVPCRVVRRR